MLNSFFFVNYKFNFYRYYKINDINFIRDRGSDVENALKTHKYFTLYRNMCVCLATYLIIKYDVLFIYKSLPYPMAIETHTLTHTHTHTQNNSSSQMFICMCIN